MRCFCMAATIILLAAAGSAERPFQSLVIADFEASEDLAKWEGLSVRRSDQACSSGQYGMAFDIPQWVEERGDEPRPGVVLRQAQGAGFPNLDWSAWGAIAIDAWVIGEAPGKLGLKIRDSQGNNSWTTHIEVTPGLRNEALLLIDDAMADMDIDDVQEIVLYALRPDHAFTLVVDKLRLLPKTQVPLASFYLQYPNYRGLIMPEAGPVTMVAMVEADAYGYEARELRLVLTLEGGGEKLSKEARFNAARCDLDIVVDKLPNGPVTLCAQVLRARNRRVLAEQGWALKKITSEERDALDVYVDRHNNTIVDGKPFFPLGMYSGASQEQLEELADSPYNTLLLYGTNRRPEKEMRAYLDQVQAKGMKLIYCLNDVYPTAAYMDGHPWDGRVSGNSAICDAVVAAYRDHPALLAWYLNDEIPRELRPHLIDYYRRVRMGDPDHPTFIVLCQPKDFKHLWDTTDILSGDPYPIPKQPVTKVVDMVEASKAPTLGAQPIWLVPQAFAWYQHNGKSPDRGRIPTEEELLEGRAPNEAEARCMTYLGLVHGAKGLIYWCYYNMRVLPQYEEMWAWMKEIGEEVQTLSPVLLSTEADGCVETTPTETPIHTLVKHLDGKRYLFAVNSSTEAATAEFRFEEKLPQQVEVLFEDRSIAPEKRAFQDTFDPLAVHVYRF